MAKLNDDDQVLLRRLKSRLDRNKRNTTVEGHVVPGFNSLRAYYQGRQRLQQLGIAVPEELRQFVTIVAWPRTYVDTIVSRLRPQGFLVEGEDDTELWRYWQVNKLDSEIRMSLTDMLTYGRGYLCAGSRPEEDLDVGAPLITVESPLELIHDWSNRERRVTAAARFYIEDTGGRHEHRATLYTRDSTRWLTRDDAGAWIDDSEPDEHGMGVVPVQPLVNRASSDDRYGESEMQAIIGLTDAAARALTNAQVATEVMSLPQRWAAGLTADDFKDPRTKKTLTAWEAYFGAVWATGNKDAKFGQFSAASLDNFKTIYGVWAGAVSGVTGLPMRYLGQATENPPSAEGIRADESRIIGTAEEKQEFASDGLEATMRTSRRIQTGEDDPRLALLETNWRSAATPTQAQATDAAVKMHAEKLISRRQALRDCGYSPAQISKIEEELRAEALDPLTKKLLDGIDNAGAA